MTIIDVTLELPTVVYQVAANYRVAAFMTYTSSANNSFGSLDI
jgi:hypothetical protein